MYLVPDPVPGRTFEDLSEHAVYEPDGPVKRVFYTEVGNATGMFFVCFIESFKVNTKLEIHAGILKIYVLLVILLSGTVFRKNRISQPPQPHSLTPVETKPSSLVHQELLSTKDWLHKYGLSNMNARLFSSSVTSKGSLSSDIGKSLSKKSTRPPNVSLKELKSYEQQIEKTMRRCTKRMKWLLKGI